MRPFIPAVIFALLAAAVSAQSPNQHTALPLGGRGPNSDAAITAQVPPPLTVTFGTRTASYTPEEFAALPHVTVTVYNDHTHARETYSGVPLHELLSRIGVPTTPRGRDFLLYLVAEGSDDYRVVYSLAEVLPTVHDATVLVADTQDNHPIPAAEGPFKLVASGEKRPARWVHSLIALHIQAAN